MIELAPHPPLDLEVRTVPPADWPHVVDKWAEDHKHSPEGRRLTWPQYKRAYLPRFRQLVASSQLLGAYRGDRLIGWICYAPGKRVSTIHWVRSRLALGSEPMRRRGVMTELVSAAGLGSRIAYTHRGPGRKHGRESTDAIVARWLGARGQIATYVPYEEWSR